MENAHYREYQLENGPGDTLFVYTDGVAEATDAANAFYGTERILAAMNTAPDHDPEELLQTLKEDIDRFVWGGPQFDDITMLVIQRKPDRGETAREDPLRAESEASETWVCFEDILPGVSAAAVAKGQVFPLQSHMTAGTDGMGGAISKRVNFHDSHRDANKLRPTRG